MKIAATRNLGMILIAGIDLIVIAAPASAHHAFAAEYDASKPVILNGIVTKVEWTNPHAHFSMNVRDGGGKVVRWDLELGSPETLHREGWSRTSLRTGDQVTVSGYLAKDGTNLANARDVRLADGRKVLTGSYAASARSR
jgi:Family of unknown function (DUF6152)